MMTTVYFVRHAEPNYDNHSDQERELTEKGLEDRKLVTQYLLDKNIDVVISSPFKRAFDTVKPFAEGINLEIEIIENFKERKVDSVWVDDFKAFSQKQWNDFSYKLTDGEALGEVQGRNIEALFGVIEKYKNKNIVIGSHGTALSTVINYFNKNYGYEDFNKIKAIFPWIVKLTFENKTNPLIEYIDVFTL